MLSLAMLYAFCQNQNTKQREKKPTVFSEKEEDFFFYGEFKKCNNIKIEILLYVWAIVQTYSYNNRKCYRYRNRKCYRYRNRKCYRYRNRKCYRYRNRTQRQRQRKKKKK
jgi:hypothetical protein